MNKQQAIDLIKNTFEKHFDKSQFIKFISNLLNLKQNEIINEHPYSGNYIPEAYKQYINSLYRIAKYEDDSEKKIVVLIVRLEKETSLERARSMQRNFIAWYLKGSRGGILKDAALVAFVSPDDDDWRFSYVKIQYLFKDNKAAEMLSSALRYSFLVGKNEISYTAQTQLRPFLLDDISKPSLEMLEQAFSVEKVSNKFFKEYKFLYEKALVEFNSNEVFTKVLEQNSNLSVDLFVRKLLGQIVFLYFLQKKGWLGIKIDKPGWKAGNRKFLRWAFDDCKKKEKNYFDRFLQPLFYTGFNKKEELFQYDEFQFKIPFLNGGLFEELFHWESAFINPSNTLFSNNEIQKDGSIGTGILDIFDRYNFTIDENTAFEKEIAVDPEMLGKVFENLLPENLRKGKGAYYTPREIVAYMTRESLVNYLTSKINPADSDDKSKIEEKVRRLFDYKDLYINKKNKDKFGKEFENQFYEMLDIVEDVNKYLQAIKIVDPACGSGAFPMGILLEIVSLREYIENEFLDNKISNYKLKKETIQNSIYGVDIDPGAVEIAKLRFWLSLVVDAEEPEPLPNLDYKIMQGNSLIESFEGIDLSNVLESVVVETVIKGEQDLLDFMDGNTQQQMVFTDDRKQKVIDLKNRYFSESDFETKKQIHKQINEIVLEHIHFCLDRHKVVLETQIAELSRDLHNRTKDKPQPVIEHLLNESKQAKELAKLQSELASVDAKFTKLEQLYYSTDRPYFLWHLFFSEIFEKENEGFDIVIANPPYVRQEKIRDLKPVLQAQNYKVYNSTSDLYTYFYELSYNLLKENGISTFISSNKWMRAKYGFKLRKFFKENTEINQIIDFGGYQVFDATVDTNIMMFQNFRSENNEFYFYQIKDDFEKTQDLRQYFKKHTLEMKQQDLDINSFTFADEKVMNLKKKIEKIGTPLKDWDVNIKRGITTGLNEAFIIDNEIKEELCRKDPKNAEILKPILRGRDINRYSYDWKGLWLIFIPWHFPLQNDNSIRGASNKAEMKFIEEYPSIYKHFLRFKDKLSSRNKDETGIRYEWYALQRCAATYYEEFEKEKIVWREIVQDSCFTWDSNKFYTLAKVYMMTGKESTKYLLAILNSKIGNYALKKFYSPFLGKTVSEFKKEWVQLLPIPKITKAKQQPFIKIVDQILIDKKAGKDTQILEDKIDLMVYKLYGLTYEEMKIVDPAFALSREEYETFKLK